MYDIRALIVAIQTRLLKGKMMRRECFLLIESLTEGFVGRCRICSDNIAVRVIVRRGKELIFM